VTAADIITRVGVGLALLLSVWNKSGLGKLFKGIKDIKVQLDGMLEYRDRANRSEATVDEKNKADDRADRKEHDKG
jgi:hypothetical protein